MGNTINFDNGLVKTKKGWPKPTFLVVYMVADSSAPSKASLIKGRFGGIVYMVADSSALAHKKSDNLSIIAVR